MVISLKLRYRCQLWATDLQEREESPSVVPLSQNHLGILGTFLGTLEMDKVLDDLVFTVTPRASPECFCRAAQCQASFSQVCFQFCVGLQPWC